MAEKRSSSSGDDNIVVPLRPRVAGSADIAAFDAMLAEHDRLLALCQELEQIADTLPAPASASLCRDVIIALANHHGTMAQHCAATLTPALNGPWQPLAKRIAAMQAEQEGLGQEISLALDHMARTQKVESPDMLGYMLRAWFEGCKRLVVIEELALAAFGRHVLSQAQMAQLESRFTH